MKTKALLALLTALVVTGIGRAEDTPKPDVPVKITFVAPEKFTDVSDDVMSSDNYRAHVLAEFKAQIESLARDYITDGRRLEIKVTDIDLAGDFEPWRGVDFNHIRIMRDVYPPLIKLEFRLLGADGRVISEGKRELRQAGYLMALVLPTHDPLRYDKENIRAWMRAEFGHLS